MNKQTYRHIIFDLDGTLLNSEKGIRNALRYTLAEMDIDFDLDKKFKEFIGPPLHHGFRNVVRLSEEDSDKAVLLFREYYGKKGVYESTLYQGISEMLTNLILHKKYLYIATSKFEKYTLEILKNLKIDHFFTAVAGAAYKGQGADKVYLLEKILSNIPANETKQVVMVGDSQYDMSAASELGINSIGVLYGYGTETELKKGGAQLLADDIYQLHLKLLK